MKRRHALIAGFLALAMMVIAGCGSKPGAGQQTGATQGAPVRGGVLKVAIIGDPPSLDSHWTTNFLTQTIGSNIFEALFALDEKYQPKPMLAESYDLSSDGKVYTIRLRKGVKFHNGKELTSADVLASLQRWGKLTASGKTLYRVLDQLTGPDAHTVVIKLKEPLAIVPLLLAGSLQQSNIFPKESIEAAGDQQIKVADLIGTGPYKLAEYVPNRHLRAVRYDGYQARSEPSSLLSGKKHAYVDEIQFIPVPEPQIRIQGVQTGEYHYAEEVPQDLHSTIAGDSKVKSVIIKPWWYPILVFNKKQGLFANVKARQAIAAALDYEPAMTAAFGNKEFFRLDPSLHFKETAWWTDEAKELYNQKNPAKAKQLLQEAGYKGETIRILTSKQYDWMYKLVVALKPQFEAIGMTVQLDVVDWATLVDRRAKPDQYDIFTTAQVFFPDPSMPSNWDDNWPGWWVNSDKDVLVKQIAQETDHAKRFELHKQFQRMFWTELPFIKTGDFFLFSVASQKLQGPIGTPFPHYFNSWLSK